MELVLHQHPLKGLQGNEGEEEEEEGKKKGHIKLEKWSPLSLETAHTSPRPASRAASGAGGEGQWPLCCVIMDICSYEGGGGGLVPG